MKRAAIYGAAILTAANIACASRRERGQSALEAERHTAHTQRDSTWHHRAFAGKTVELLEVEVSIGSTDRLGRCYVRSGGCYFPTGRLTDPRIGGTAAAGTGYIRLRRLTVNADSGTVSGGSASERDSLTSERVESSARSVGRRARTALPWWLWGLACLLVLLSVYRLARKVNR